MEKLEILISLAGTAVALVASLLTFIVKFLKSAKAKKIAEQTIKICDAVLPYIKEAEAFVNYGGQEKKEF